MIEIKQLTDAEIVDAFRAGIKEDLDAYFKNRDILTEDNFFTYWDARNHYEKHVCKKDEEYTGEEEMIRLENEERAKPRILFPYMPFREYIGRGNKFLNDLNVGLSHETKNPPFGWETDRWGKRRNTVYVKFRYSDVPGPKEDGLMEYIMFEPIFSKEQTTVSLPGGASYSTYNIIDTKIISYGLVLRRPLRQLFKFVDELPPSQRKNRKAITENYVIEAMVDLKGVKDFNK